MDMYNNLCYFSEIMSKFGRRIKEAPDGYEYIEETITALEHELRESRLQFFFYTFLFIT